jgi:gamma-glutamyltranspeptidase/glutathione hydrolase
VVAPRSEALNAGRSILDAGGNAVDAVVAMSLVQAVCEPYMTGPGGVGEAVYLSPDNACVIMDAIGFAPLAAHAEMFTVDEALDLHPRGWPRVMNDENTFGVKAVTAPRLVSGLARLHEQSGVLPWFVIAEPAVEEARRGAVVDYFTAAKIALSMRTLAADRFASSLYYPDGFPSPAPITEAPQRVSNEPLIRTLEAIQSGGEQALTNGFVGQAIVAHCRSLGGLLCDQDLSRQAKIEIGTAPLIRYRGWEVYGSPHPSGAPTVATILALLDRLEPPNARVDNVAKYQAVIRACIAAMHDRWTQLAGDIDEYAIRALLDDAHLSELAEQDFDLEEAVVAAMPGSSTTHCAACDPDGGACAMTTTLVTSFGAQVAVPDCGIFLNNGMQWFDPRPGKPASIASGKRGMTAMSPLILRNPSSDRLVVLSGIGGVPIITGVAQAAHDVIRHGVSIDRAVDLPRVHAQVTARGVIVGYDERLGCGAERALALDGLPFPLPWHYGPTSMGGARLIGIDYDRQNQTAICGIDQRSQAVWRFGRRPEDEIRIV